MNVGSVKSPLLPRPNLRSVSDIPCVKDKDWQIAGDFPLTLEYVLQNKPGLEKSTCTLQEVRLEVAFFCKPFSLFSFQLP